MPYGLIFDCDGTLADTEALICRATMNMFKEDYGVEMQPEDFNPLIGQGPVRYVAGQLLLKPVAHVPPLEGYLAVRDKDRQLGEYPCIGALKV